MKPAATHQKAAKGDGADYFAVPDPTNPRQITYWRRTSGRLKPWPAKARYGPVLYRTDLPEGLKGQAQQEWIIRWHRQHTFPWHEAIRAAVDSDPTGCAARFAAFTTRCCQCGKQLHDPTSKTYGVGPDCRDGWPDAVLALMVEAVGRAHAAAAALEAA
ncbi:DUF6011 domain-containing protein [Verrucosispora sp. NA02020]|uniref:DUF6011 domain-containing protein n=1 Tax=Verrucosispora sp. NA02020 TaxID=2742132 RepID=UPI001590B886|nr:DUF6011 domain-containing protein [Verrucosispora sp. NA02020]QKW15457.1 hypothetical protein HUT12_23595 [Verrucosispora sp. NA02020]